jgi:trk system potassium uptake protein TrkA
MYIIIIGCGRLGSNLARELADNGNDICIIDRSNDKLNTLGSGFNGQRIKGIEFDSDNLLEAGVKKADALLAVTPNDNINLTVSLIAGRIFHVPKIIARVNDPGKKIIYNQLEINTINPIQYEIEIVRSKLLINSIDVVTALDNNYEIIDIPVNKENYSISVQDVERKYCCIISGLVKDGEVKLPEKNEDIHNGDRIICTVGKKNKGKLINSFNKEILL